MNLKKIIVKDDINFLEHPNWVVSTKSNTNKLVIARDKGKYEVKSSEGLPTRFDKIVLYYLLQNLFHKDQLKSTEIITTRYEITRNIFFNKKSIGKVEYDRIMLALKRWKAIFISFEGIFYTGDDHTIRYFCVIDEVILNAKTKKLYIRFNPSYIKQLQESKFYKLINFEEYKKLTRPVSARLYEILVKSFQETEIWNINSQNLAEKLTLEKRPSAKKYYVNDLLTKLRPAINEINKNTDVHIEFKYDKQKDVCLFKKAVPKEAKKNAKENEITPDEEKKLEILAAHGISPKKAQKIAAQYSLEDIQERIKMPNQTKTPIKNMGAWLTQAFQENWSTGEQTSFIDKAKQEKKQATELKVVVEELKAEHRKYKEMKAQEIYQQLPVRVQKTLDEQFFLFLKQKQEKTPEFKLPENLFKIQFLIDNLLEPEEQDFDKWALLKGYSDKFEHEKAKEN